jgi:chitinase
VRGSYVYLGVHGWLFHLDAIRGELHAAESVLHYCSESHVGTDLRARLVRATGIGLPAAVSAGNGYTAPGFRGLMTWSINWDRYYNWGFQNDHAPYLDALR